MPKATVETGGKVELAGRMTDELLRLLMDQGYWVELGQLKLGDGEAHVTLKVAIPLQPSLLD